jgi:hypothetical protein
MGADYEASLRVLALRLRALRLKPTVRGTMRLVADGFEPSLLSSVAVGTQHRLGEEVSDVRTPGGQDQDDDGDFEARLVGDGFIVASEATPSWLFDSDITDVAHELTVWLARRRLVAIFADATVLSRLQGWIDGNPAPPFRRVPPGVLNAVLLQGEGKNLWLQGAHPRRSTKADSKQVSGTNLQEAMNPLEDGSFVLGAARAALLDRDDYPQLRGTAGTSPRRSTVWLRRTIDFADFCGLTADLLGALAEALSDGSADEQPFPWLAAEVHDFEAVRGAFEMVTLSMADLRPGSLAQDVLDAAELLEQAVLLVTPKVNSADFFVDVGLDGSLAGRLECQVMPVRGQVLLRFGMTSHITDLGPTRLVLDALTAGSDLLTVHYDSGHTLTGQRMWVMRVADAPFPNWRWTSYAGFDVSREKPSEVAPQAIHDAIGMAADDSLFSWVAARFGADGFLTCDDGANEVADFVHLADDWTLTLIHVKGATSAAAGRRTSVGAYEIVVSQAAKNVRYLDSQQLIGSLQSPGVTRPACWASGSRVVSRDDMLEYLAVRPASAPARIIVVQPHMQEASYAAAQQQPHTHNGIRVRLLDTLLNVTRASATGLGADLEVWGSA